MKKILVLSLVLFFTSLTASFAMNEKDTLKIKATDSVAYSKLSADQIYELEKMKIGVEESKAMAMNKPDFQKEWKAAGAFVTVAPFVFVILLIFVIFYFG